MNEVEKRVGSLLRARGFSGSGQNFRRFPEHFVFIVNLQGNKRGNSFYVNLGAQPKFIPAEANSPINERIKEYECVFRKRLDGERPWDISGKELDNFLSALDADQEKFFSAFSEFTSALATKSLDALLIMFPVGVTRERAALHFARACEAIGQHDRARALANQALATTPERARGLISELNALIEHVNGAT